MQPWFFFRIPFSFFHRQLLFKCYSLLTLHSCRVYQLARCLQGSLFDGDLGGAAAGHLLVTLFLLRFASMRLPDLMSYWTMKLMSRRTMRIVAVAVCLPLVLGPSTRATDSGQLAEESTGVGSIWLISTRHLGCAGNATSSNDPDLTVMRYDEPSEAWSDATLQSFLDEDVAIPTVFYIHGNRRGWHDAFQRGWAFHHALATEVGSKFRLVIWSWPADQMRGALRDVRAKASRTNADGYYLGWLLARMRPDAQVSLVGFSFGARIITGAMHLLSSGTLAGVSLNATSSPREPLRAVLLAAAIHSDWLLPGRPHESIWPVTDQISVLYNSSDPVLQRYHLVERRGKPQALGHVGFWGSQQLGDTAERLSNRDVSCYVGRTHDIDAYFCSSTVMSWVRDASLWQVAGDQPVVSEGVPSEIADDLDAVAVQK